jgi:hypothetical protein
MCNQERLIYVVKISYQTIPLSIRLFISFFTYFYLFVTGFFLDNRNFLMP